MKAQTTALFAVFKLVQCGCYRIRLLNIDLVCVCVCFINYRASLCQLIRTDTKCLWNFAERTMEHQNHFTERIHWKSFVFN